jgi:G3E family GTPase
MKKILLIVLLLVLVVAVSYIKTVREHQRSEAFYDDGKMAAARDVDAYQKETDSLKKATAEQQLAFADSLVQKDTRHRSEVDSLENVVDQLEQKVNTLSQDKSSTTATVTKKPTTKTLSKHEKILDYYKRRFANLPKDLSEYEKRIAINEIREETSQKFSISLSELKKIREKYKLTY